jgi:pyrimidine deaminase RibD-like protein
MTDVERSDVDAAWLTAAVELSRRCPPSASAFAVGAVVVAADQSVLAEGWSRRDHPNDHAEEGALRRIDPGDPRLDTATLYSSLEPCSRRLSRPRSCTALILAGGIRRVVFALREPAVFVEGRGAEELAAAGVVVVERPDFADRVRAVNRHVLDPHD